MNRYFALLAALVCLSACGMGSVSPIVTDADILTDSRLIGSWQDAQGRESAVITAAGPTGYRILYTDDDHKTGEFDARLGRLGALRVLDVQPVEPLPSANDVYRSLVLRAHGLIVVDSLGVALHVRIINPDSLKAYLARQPKGVAHALVDEAVLLTGSSPEVRRLLQEFLARPGVLEKPDIWQRKR